MKAFSTSLLRRVSSRGRSPTVEGMAAKRSAVGLER
jgi:hypothetical protein